MKTSLVCPRINRRTWIFIPLLFLFCVGSATPQQNNQPKELPLNELLRLQGKVVAEGSTTRGTGNPNITGYRVEELQLPRSLNVELRGQQVSVDRAWRITLNGGPFPVRDLPAVVWIDDQIVGNGIENETLS